MSLSLVDVYYVRKYRSRTNDSNKKSNLFKMSIQNQFLQTDPCIRIALSLIKTNRQSQAQLGLPDKVVQSKGLSVT